MLLIGRKEGQMIHSDVSTAAGAASKPSARAALLVELENAYDELRRCMKELYDVLDQQGLDRARLTSVRLKIAQIRLARGPLVGRITVCLADKVNPSEAAALQELRANHDQMLRAASVHTGKWTLDAIAENWAEYRTTTRQLARCWMEKVKQEQDQIYPLLKRCS